MNQETRSFSSLVIPVVLAMVVLFSTTSVFAQESIHATESSKIDYQLSYPGLLPDHPLYFLKAGRDRIMSFFISDPVKKAEFNVLQADKRIMASYMLVEKKKVDLAQSTFSKAENYFEGALNRANDAKTQGNHIEELSKKLRDANLKHQEVLDNISMELAPGERKKFSVERDRLKEFEKRVKQLDPK